MATTKRVYVCFDYDNDLDMKNALKAQSKLDDSPFEIIDWSMKEEEKEEEWKKEARRRIKRSDIVIVLLGKKTYKAPGVLAEVKITGEEEIRIFQLRPQNTDNAKVEGAGPVYLWTWDNLKEQLK